MTAPRASSLAAVLLLAVVVAAVLPSAAGETAPNRVAINPDGTTQFLQTESKSQIIPLAAMLASPLIGQAKELLPKIKDGLEKIKEIFGKEGKLCKAFLWSKPKFEAAKHWLQTRKQTHEAWRRWTVCREVSDMRETVREMNELAAHIVELANLHTQVTLHYKFHNFPEDLPPEQHVHLEADLLPPVVASQAHWHGLKLKFNSKYYNNIRATTSGTRTLYLLKWSHYDEYGNPKEEVPWIEATTPWYQCIIPEEEKLKSGDKRGEIGEKRPTKQDIEKIYGQVRDLCQHAGTNAMIRMGAAAHHNWAASQILRYCTHEDALELHDALTLLEHKLCRNILSPRLSKCEMARDFAKSLTEVFPPLEKMLDTIVDGEACKRLIHPVVLSKEAAGVTCTIFPVYTLPVVVEWNAEVGPIRELACPVMVAYLSDCDSLPDDEEIAELVVDDEDSGVGNIEEVELVDQERHDDEQEVRPARKLLRRLTVAEDQQLPQQEAEPRLSPRKACIKDRDAVVGSFMPLKNQHLSSEEPSYGDTNDAMFKDFSPEVVDGICNKIYRSKPKRKACSKFVNDMDTLSSQINSALLAKVRTLKDYGKAVTEICSCMVPRSLDNEEESSAWKAKVSGLSKAQHLQFLNFASNSEPNIVLIEEEVVLSPPAAAAAAAASLAPAE